MKVLITGNSQAGALRKAARENGPPPGVSLSFYVTPGGTGPYFDITPDGRLEENSPTRKGEPFCDPPGTEDIPIAQYDAIVISALGFVDGGVKFRGPFADGPFVAEFAPANLGSGDQLVSMACFKEVHQATVLGAAFNFAAQLRKHYAGMVLVQPMPYPSAESRQSPTWATGQRYQDADGFHSFLTRMTDSLLEDFCATHALTLLPRPSVAIVPGPFTSMDHMREQDGVHPNARYGQLVLDQIAAAVNQAIGAKEPTV